MIQKRIKIGISIFPHNFKCCLIRMHNCFFLLNVFYYDINNRFQKLIGKFSQYLETLKTVQLID